METETDTQPAPVVEEVQELPKEADEGVAEIIHEEGRRVKVYELRDQSWHDRGTGHCRGRYDGDRDRAVLLVEAESEDKEEGGFVKEALLLDATVEKEDIYARQQDTLIVWTDPSGLDIALSFQDAEGCEDIWQFIMEVQRHLNNQPSDADPPASSSPLSASPMLALTTERIPWTPPTLQNIREQYQLLGMQSRSAQGRERVVEHILTEDYIRNLIYVFQQAEDLESLDDLHVLCGMMQAIIMLNDNGILEYVLQDDIFEGVIGALEYDRDYPTSKASFRQVFKEVSKFRQVVEIKDPAIRTKIHHTYRLQYLREIVLTRILDDPMFNILNGCVFFNQVDIVAHIQNNESILNELFRKFTHEKQPDTVLFLHQLMIMGKSIQAPSRMTLYRNLVEQGLPAVIQWGLQQREAAVANAAAEMLTILTDNDVAQLRRVIAQDHADKNATLLDEIIALHGRTQNLGLLSQMTDALRTLLDPPQEDAFPKRDHPEAFLNYFYEECCDKLFAPLDALPDATSETRLDRRTAAATQHLIELLYYCVANHLGRVTNHILKTRINEKVMRLLYMKDKPLRLVALRYLKTCLKSGNHFLQRSFAKGELFAPLIALLEEESRKDNMLTSACMIILDEVRKDNVKSVINHMFDTYRPRIDALTKRPFFRTTLQALHVRWEQNNEPPPPPPPQEEELIRREEGVADEYFQQTDDEETTPTSSKRKRTLATTSPNKRKSPKSSTIGQSALGLDQYDDNSDSDSGSPKQKAEKVDLEKPELAEELGDVAEQMRLKRAREDDEEDGFGLVAKREKAQVSEEKGRGGQEVKDAKEEGSTKLKFNWGTLKRLGSGSKKDKDVVKEEK